MNRYVIQGIHEDAKSGKRVVFAAAQPDDLSQTTLALLDQVENDPAVSKVCRVNGRESISWTNGGRVSFHLGHQGLRGVRADVTVVAGWNDLSHDSRADLAVAVAATGELIRL